MKHTIYQHIIANGIPDFLTNGKHKTHKWNPDYEGKFPFFLQMEQINLEKCNHAELSSLIISLKSPEPSQEKNPLSIQNYQDEALQPENRDIPQRCEGELIQQINYSDYQIPPICAPFVQNPPDISDYTQRETNITRHGDPKTNTLTAKFMAMEFHSPTTEGQNSGDKISQYHHELNYQNTNVHSTVLLTSKSDFKYTQDQEILSPKSFNYNTAVPKTVIEQPLLIHSEPGSFQILKQEPILETSQDPGNDLAMPNIQVYTTGNVEVSDSLASLDVKYIKPKIQILQSLRHPSPIYNSTKSESQIRDNEISYKDNNSPISQAVLTRYQNSLYKQSTTIENPSVEIIQNSIKHLRVREGQAYSNLVKNPNILQKISSDEVKQDFGSNPGFSETNSSSVNNSTFSNAAKIINNSSDVKPMIHQGVTSVIHSDELSDMSSDVSSASPKPQVSTEQVALEQAVTVRETEGNTHNTPYNISPHDTSNTPVNQTPVDEAYAVTDKPIIQRVVMSHNGDGEGVKTSVHQDVPSVIHSVKLSDMSSDMSSASPKLQVSTEQVALEQAVTVRETEGNTHNTPYNISPHDTSNTPVNQTPVDEAYAVTDKPIIQRVVMSHNGDGENIKTTAHQGASLGPSSAVILHKTHVSEAKDIKRNVEEWLYKNELLKSEPQMGQNVIVHRSATVILGEVGSFLINNREITTENKLELKNPPTLESPRTHGSEQTDIPRQDAQDINNVSSTHRQTKEIINVDAKTDIDEIVPQKLSPDKETIETLAYENSASKLEAVLKPADTIKPTPGTIRNGDGFLLGLRPLIQHKPTDIVFLSETQKQYIDKASVTIAEIMLDSKEGFAVSGKVQIADTSNAMLEKLMVVESIASNFGAQLDYLTGQNKGFSDEVCQTTSSLAELPDRISMYVSSISAFGKTGTIFIQLEPVNLGKIKFKVSLKETKISADLIVQRPETKTIIELQLPGIRKSLAQHGIEIKDLNISMENSSSGSSSRHSGLFRNSVSNYTPSAYSLREENDEDISYSKQRYIDRNATVDMFA